MSFNPKIKRGAKCSSFLCILCLIIKEKVILFNLSGHGLIDMASYDRYFAGELQNYQVPEEEIAKNVAKLEKLA